MTLFAVIIIGKISSQTIECVIFVPYDFLQCARYNNYLLYDYTVDTPLYCILQVGYDAMTSRVLLSWSDPGAY